MTTKQLDIKGRSHHFDNDSINIEDFNSKNFKLDKKNQ